MEKFRSDYILFFRELQKFVDLLLQGFKEEVPAVLRDVKVVLTVLPEDDNDFDNTNLDNVLVKFRILRTVTLAVVAKISLLVREEYRGTLENLSQDLKWRIDSLEMILGSLVISGISPRVPILPPGVGGVNTGVRCLMSEETQDKVLEILARLQEM